MFLKLEFAFSSSTFLLILMQQNKFYDYPHLKISRGEKNILQAESYGFVVNEVIEDSYSAL